MTRPPSPFRRHGDLAAAVLRQADAVLADAASVDARHVERLWAASRRRSSGWVRTLSHALRTADERPLSPGEQATAVAAAGEVLCGEMVTRLWACVLAEHDRRHGSRLSSVADRVMQDHLRGRLETLRLLTHTTALRADPRDDLDAVRRRCERWTDCLLAGLPGDAGRHTVGGTPAAFEDDRRRAFAADPKHVRRSTVAGRTSVADELVLRIGVSGGPGAAANRAFTAAVADVIEARRKPAPPTPKLQFRRLFPRD